MKAVFDLMFELGAEDWQLDFPTVYGSAKQNWMSEDWRKPHHVHRTSFGYGCGAYSCSCQSKRVAYRCLLLLWTILPLLGVLLLGAYIVAPFRQV